MAAANLKIKYITAEGALEVLFQNDFSDSDSESSSYDINKNDSNLSINSDYNERSSNQPVHNSITFQPDLRRFMRSMQVQMPKKFLF